MFKGTSLHVSESYIYPPCADVTQKSGTSFGKPPFKKVKFFQLGYASLLLLYFKYKIAQHWHLL